VNPLFTVEEMQEVLAHPQKGSGEGIGLYRNGYRSHGLDFWGLKPGSEVVHFFNQMASLPWTEFSVLELGAGTGKNIMEFVRRDVKRAIAVEIDSLAMATLLDVTVKLEESGLLPEGRIALVKDDALSFLKHNREQFDIVVCYGLLHVFKEESVLHQVIDAIRQIVLKSGYLIMQSLTDKYPAPDIQPELKGVIMNPERIKTLFGPENWSLLHWDETDIVHSHAGSEENHRHGSVRAIFKHCSASK